MKKKYFVKKSHVLGDVMLLYIESYTVFYFIEKYYLTQNPFEYIVILHCKILSLSK